MQLAEHQEHEQAAATGRSGGWGLASVLSAASNVASTVVDKAQGSVGGYLLEYMLDSPNLTKWLKVFEKAMKAFDPLNTTMIANLKLKQVPESKSIALAIHAAVFVDEAKQSLRVVRCTRYGGKFWSLSLSLSP